MLAVLRRVFWSVKPTQILQPFLSSTPKLLCYTIECVEFIKYFVNHDSWPMHDLWPIICDHWPMTHEPRLMTMAHDSWLIAHGLWPVACGPWSMNHDFYDLWLVIYTICIPWSMIHNICTYICRSNDKTNVNV